MRGRDLTKADKNSDFRAALVQMRSGADVRENLMAASTLIREAAAGGAHYVQTPEMTGQFAPEGAKLHVRMPPEEGNAELAHFKSLARELEIWLHVGSLGVLVSNKKVANRSFLFAPDGAMAARYDKIHMFDAKLTSSESYKESRSYRPGKRAVLADLPWGTLGFSICYDLRFANLYRELAKAGADFLAVPSAFTKTTGEVHWHVLLKARAIETGCFVFAAAQGGHHQNGRQTYGHSLIVAPWGEILAEASGDDPGVIYADIDCGLIGEARRRLCSLHADGSFEVVHAEPAPLAPSRREPKS